jgi:hypothetical protein
VAVKIKTGADLLIKCCVTSKQTADIWNSEVGQNILAPPWGLHPLRSLATRLETWTVRYFLSNSKFFMAHVNRLGLKTPFLANSYFRDKQVFLLLKNFFHR